MVSWYVEWAVPTAVAVAVLFIIGTILFLYFLVDPNFELQEGNRVDSREPLYPPCTSVPITSTPQTTSSHSIIIGDNPSSPISPLNVLEVIKKGWEIIYNNAAVVDIKEQSVNVIPDDIKGWHKLECWSPSPVSRSFCVTVKNRLGKRVLIFDYQLQYFYGGSSHGKGKYLADVSVIPTKVFVAWGYKLNAKVEISAMRNVGTCRNVIAAAHVGVHFRLKGLNIIERRVAFNVRGDGQMDT